MPSPTLMAVVRHVVEYEQDTLTAQELGVDLTELRNALTRLAEGDPPVVEDATPSGYLGPARLWRSCDEMPGDAVATYLSAAGFPADVSLADFLLRSGDG